MTNIKTVAGRSRLTPRRDPYWEKVEGSLYVGWRRMTADGDAHWSARMLEPETGKRIFKSIGVLAEVSDGQRWDAAKREAEAWAQHVSAGGVSAERTVRDACAAYVKHLRGQKREKAAADAEKRFASYVLDDARFADAELAKLTPSAVQAWRERLSARPVHRGSGNSKTGSKATDKERSASSLNRDMVPFKAALNLAFSDGWVTSDFAWRNKLKPIEKADQRRDVYLDKKQRQRFIEAAPADLGNFLKALASLPVRPGALAELRVRDFNASLGQLSIRVDKTGSRAFELPEGVATFFCAMCKDKLPAAHIFTRADGVVWNKDRWKDGVKAAAKAAALPDNVSAYTLRHSVITDLVRSGLDLASVATISGTSVKMIQEHYKQHQASDATAALAQVAAAA